MIPSIMTTVLEIQLTTTPQLNGPDQVQVFVQRPFQLMVMNAINMLVQILVRYHVPTIISNAVVHYIIILTILSDGLVVIILKQVVHNKNKNNSNNSNSKK